MKLKQSKCIYVFHNPRIGISKIGVSDDVNKRLSTIQCSAGMKIEFVFSSMPIYNYVEIEKKIHEKFKKYRGFGEWFETDKNTIVQYIQSISNTFDIDVVFKQWILNSNISLLSKSFDVSRTAISKHLAKYNHIENNGLFVDDVKKDFFNNELKVEEVKEDELKDIPVNCINIKKNIYEKDGAFYVKKFIHSRWFIKKLSNVNECEIYLKKIS